MKILVDALFLRPGENGGGETYIRGLLSALSSLDDENAYLVLVRTESRDTFRSLAANFETHAINLKRGSIVQRLAYEQTVLPILARRWRADVAFFPANMMSLGVAALAIPSVVTIHDASSSYYQKTLPRYEQSIVFIARAILANWAAHAATQIVAVSEFGRSEILRTTGVRGNKVSVVHLGSPEFSASFAEREEVFQRLGIAKPYVLAVGRVLKHKNFDRLVRAFIAAKKSSNFPHRLVIAGRSGWGQADLETAIDSSGAGNDVRLTGFVQDEELATLYREADVFVMPSLYEGFGLPVIEAMKAGLPVLCSTSGSLPEVCGNAALFCDPLDEASISRNLCKIISDRGLAMELVRKGRLQAEKFTWERTAARMLEIFRSVAQRETFSVEALTSGGHASSSPEEIQETLPLARGIRPATKPATPAGRFGRSRE